MSRPGHTAVLLHVVVGDRIGDALIAESGDQPIEDRRGVALSDCCADPLSLKVGANVVDQARRPGEAANAIDHANRMIDGAGSVARLRRWCGLGGAMLNCRPGAHALPP